VKRQSARDLRLAVVGLGLIGSRYVRVFCENLGLPVAAHDLDASKGERLAAQYGVRSYERLDDMLERERPDVVAVATPDHAHEAPVKRALEAGAHVLVEKPLATELRAAVEMVELAQAQGRALAVNYSQRWVTEFSWIKAQIAGGRIGKPVMVTSTKVDTISVPAGMIG
jgi:UDP-N-acetyl-2-amino-2-deoxyglucuronate dehydrogenase